jgi:hypothetical protein
LDCNGKSYAISSGAFSTCTIDTIVFNSNVTSIDEYAFYDSRINGNIYFTGTEKQWKAIDGASSLQTPIYGYESDQ